MAGFSTSAAASILVGLALGAAATFGATLALEDQGKRPARNETFPASPNLPQYGGRCFHGHCVPCDSPSSCINKLPPQWRP